MKLLPVGILLISCIFCTVSAKPFDDDEDLGDILSHFDQLLNGDSETAPKENEEKVVDTPPVAPPPPPPPAPAPLDPASIPKASPADDYGEEDDIDDADYEAYLSKVQQKETPTENDQADCECKKYFECNVGGGSGGQGVDNKNPPPIDIPEVDVRWGDSIRTSCGHYFDICCDSIRDNTTEIQREPDYQHTICGKRNPEGVGFRVKGAVNQESQFGEFPWMAAIVSPERQEGKPTVNVFVCGGSLIHPGVILTAAHCVHKKTPQELIVRLGEWDTQTTDELYSHKDHSVIRVVIHEDFYAGALYNDVALLFLASETKFAPHIDTLCLPPININFDGQRCYASGWGRDSFGKEGRYSVILKKLDLPIVRRDTCENALKRTRLGRYFRLHESFVCAGGEKGRDTCRGDGGSPLVCSVPGSDSYVLYGIVAWGIGCGEEGVPGVYVNVPTFVKWITRKMTDARLNTSYFKLGRRLFR